MSPPSPLPPSPPVLAFDRVSKVFTDHPAGTEALADVSFAVPAGAFHALVGPSGAGKSTLLRLAADLATPTAGSVRVCGEAPERARRARQIGLVFQAPVLMAWRDVGANVSLPLEVAGVARAERAARVSEVLDLVGCMDKGKPAYRSYFVKNDPAACNTTTIGKGRKPSRSPRPGRLRDLDPALDLKGRRIGR